MRWALTMVGAVLAASVACGGPRGPIVGAQVPEGVGGTIAGLVSGNDGSTPVSARRVTAVNTETGARFDVTTAINGGYTVKVPAGMYRLEVELRSGETVSKQPENTNVNVGDLDADRDFIVTVR